MLDAMECTCPNGIVWRGVFDRRGEWYRVPEWIVVEPGGLVEDGGDAEGGSGGKGKGAVAGDGQADTNEEELGEMVKVRCRLSSDGRDVVVRIHKGERVGGLVVGLKAKAKVCWVTSCYSWIYHVGDMLTDCTDQSLRLCSHRLRRQDFRGKPTA